MPAKKKPDKWNPRLNGISPSFLKLWLRCREHARIRYIEGLVSTRSSEAVLYGTLYHHVLEKTSQGATVREAHEDYKESYGSDWTEEQDLERCIGLTRIIHKWYEKVWEEDDKNITWKSRESILDL